MQRTIYCYAEGKGKNWEGLCLDFDIAVQGDSFEDVKAQLNDAIVDYVQYAMTLPEEEREHLLARRAPFREQMRFLWGVLRLSLFRRKGENKSRYGYTTPCVA